MKMSRLVAFSSSLLLGAALALTGAGIANADSSVKAVDYVALGDSYSSGVGAGSYDSASGDCKRSTRAFPRLWANAIFQLRLHRLLRRPDQRRHQRSARTAQRLHRTRLDLHRRQ
ncbi:hypothetical protein SMICM304S_00663 [Streptomyces microflavus]